MKFLGEVSEDKIPVITEAIRTAIKDVEPFDIHVRGVGVFPSLRYIRVVWAGIAEGRDHIIAIQQNLDRELEKLGFKPEREFVPHLTLARVKTARHKEKLAMLVERMVNEEFGVTHARAIELKQSKLTPKGPIYTTLARIEFG
jgi:2'-5' RNA ligase